LNARLPLVRRWLGLPPTGLRCERSTEWVPLSDGTRLATTVLRPAASGKPARSALLLRSPGSADAPLRAVELLATLLAERGHLVALQTCRGLGESEGHFAAFENEASDGAEALAWLAGRPDLDGRIGLVGLGYGAYTAWAALSRSPVPVHALAVGFGTRDPHAWLYAGGALRLALALDLGARLGGREPAPRRRLELARAARHRPAREADRVAWRRSDAYRDWLDHPEPDGWWRERTPELPEPPPPALLVAGSWHPTLCAMLRDRTALAEAARRSGAPLPEWVLGAWGAERRRTAGGRAAFAGFAGAAADFLERRLLGAQRVRAPVRVFVQGTGRWRETSDWPPPNAEPRVLHLRSGGRANGAAGDGRLAAAEPDADERPDHYVYDPADAAPASGAAAERGDVLCYSSDALAQDLVLLGPVRVVLHAASQAPDTDFTARLLRVERAGFAFPVCEGVVRCRRREGAAESWLAPGRSVRLEIDLGVAAQRLRAGERIRLEVSSSCFPHFDRHPNTRAEPALAGDGDGVPARQTLFHDAQRPSHLALCVARS
jgi:uncharacterized protein